MVQVGKNKLHFLYFLFFLSGFTSLIYQVLWLKQLRLLFGSTAYATATTLTVFFLGLAIGGYTFGKLVNRFRNPLRVFAFLQLGIGVSTLLYFLLLDAFYIVYPSLFSIAGGSIFLMTLSKFLLALVLLLPAAVLIGATLPVISQFLVKKKQDLGKTVSFLYAINTLGAALGVFSAGFFLPQIIGYRLSYILAISINLAIAASALFLSFLSNTFRISAVRKAPLAKARLKANEDKSANIVTVLIFFSGFIVLSLEVLFTLMLSQVIVNDLYSFSLILVTFMLSLALGAFIARNLSHRVGNPWFILNRILILSAIVVGGTPLVFYFATGGLIPVTTTSGWGNYLLSLFATTAIIILIPATVTGIVFPYLLKILPEDKTTGEIVGSWVSVNTIGAILGSLAAGFIFIKFLGLWMSIGLLASLYLGLSIFMGSAYQKGTSLKHFLFSLVLAFVFLIIIPLKLSSVRLNPDENEILLEKFTGSDGIVTVISSHPSYYPENFDDLFIRLNNTYTLGGTGSFANEQRQAHLPLFLHPNPKSVFIIGLGTGITAGASLDHPIDKVVTTELTLEVVSASEKYFAEYNNGIFTDDRSDIWVEDGRNYLSATNEKFDVIIGDIFNPWVEGVGDLYTKEHFGNVAGHLSQGGIFAQWLPLYQLTQEQFGGIVNTFLEVFPNATLWRGNFVSDKPIVVLIGQTGGFPLDPDSFITKVKRLGENNEDEVLIDALISVKGLGILVINPEAKETLAEGLPLLSESVPFTFYAGNLSENKKLFSKFPLNTDDKPLFEFLAPKVLAEQSAGKVSFFVGEKLERFFEELIASTSLEEDPFLTNLSPGQLEYVRAGMIYYQSNLHDFIGQQTGNKKEVDLGQKLYKEYLTKMGLTEYP